MKHLFRRLTERLQAAPTFVCMGATVIGFAAVAWLTPFLPLYSFYRALLIIAEAAILIYFLPAAYDATRATLMTAGDRMALGLWIAFLGDIVLGAWALAQKLTGFEWMLASQALTFIIFVKASGALLVLTAPQAVEPPPARPPWVIVLAFVSGGVFSGVVLLTALP